MNKKYSLKNVLEALIDEVKESGNPSELTIDILIEYEDDYDFIKEYFEECEKENSN